LFLGDDRTFLFTLLREMKTFHPTGYNNHFAYLNYGQETIVNGLVSVKLPKNVLHVFKKTKQISSILQGVGGSIEPHHYFAFWINDDCETGKSLSMTTTFHCPHLSSSPDFEVDSIEIWATENLFPVEQFNVCFFKQNVSTTVF
jgi:hypothetical protein